MGGALGDHRASRHDLAVRLSAGNLVAASHDPRRPAARPAHSDRRAGHARRSIPPRRRAPAGCDGALRSAQPASFTDGAPRRLTYAQADHIVSAIAGRLRRLGLPTDSVVGAAIAEHRRERARTAGRAARRHDRRADAAAVAPRPMPPRRSTASAQRPSSPARASARPITAISPWDIAAEVFPVRYVCSFGDRPTRRRDPAR